MQAHHIGDILAASQSLRLPGVGDRRVLSPIAIERLANETELPRWEIEAIALEAEIVPLQYLRHLARYGIPGQLRLARAQVALVGESDLLLKTAEELSGAGVGRLKLLIPGELSPAHRIYMERVERAIRGRNSSPAVEGSPLPLRGGNPVTALREADVVVSALPSSADEQLLQFACRMAKVPLVLGAAQGTQGQATTVLPDDPGVALVYKNSHLHLDPNRGDLTSEERAVLMVSAWLAEQALRLITEQGEVLRGRLLYADLDRGVILDQPLG